ncbi:peptide synthetase [Cylindrospermum sp. NIES-4074]|nr:peptide synthetase [Cylindrospermum sp. NIES-4074]
MSDSKLSLNFCTLVELLRYRYLHQADETAFTFLQDGETEVESLTYQEFDRQSRAIASQLQKLGLSGERALLLYPAGLDYLTAFFGCLYAGVVAVPAYPPRNHRNTPRIQAIVADAQVAVALTTTVIGDRTKSLLIEKADFGHLKWLTTDNLPPGIEANWQEPTINSDTLAFLQYTSGSTGTPKGVMLTHGNLLHNAAATYQCMEHSPSSKFVSWLPTYHDMGLIGGILQPLYGGFPCILMPPASFLQRPYRWLQAISCYQGTTSGAPNFAYELCIQKITDEQKQTLDLSSWSVAFNGAEPIRHDTLERFAAAFAVCGFRKAAVYPCYGLAEGSLMVTGSRKAEVPVFKAVDETALERNQVIAADNKNPYILVSSGQCIPDQEIIIVNPQTLNCCQPGEVGEIWVSGPSIGQGYWHRLTETNNTFSAYTSDTKQGPFLRTGDLGFLENGELFVTGRAKDLIIIRGRNLYPQDIELTAECSHQSLRAGSIAAFTIEVGNGEQLVVVQEVEFRQKPNVEEVTAAIRQAVAEEHEIQVYAVVLIKAGTISKTSSGKIQRRATRAQYLAGELEVLGSSILENTDSQRSEHQLNCEAILATNSAERQEILEEYLQQLVSKILGLKPKINQPLSAFGLDSLKVFELKNRVEADFAVSLSVTELFEGVSIAQLAQLILEQLTVSTTPYLAIAPVSRNQDLPLSFAQQRLWFLDQLEPESPFYNLAATVTLAGQLNLEVLISSLNEIVKKHEILRTKFINREGQAVQIVLDEIELNLPVIDLSRFSAEQREKELEYLCLREARTPFDLQQGYLLKAKVFHVSAKEHILLLTAHHIVFDGWSMGVFIRELAEFYINKLHIKSLSHNLPIQYVDFAFWQRQWLQSAGIFQTQLDYWKQQLSGNLPILNLPTDFPRPAVQTFQGARQTFTVSQELTKALTELSQQEETTLFITLLTAFKTLLYRYTGEEDILVGSPIANRNRAEIENLIGFFVNTLVLRTNLKENPSFRELLSRVREVALGAYAHQDLPFEKLVEELQPNRGLSYSPLFQVSFALQNGLTQTLDLPELKLNIQEFDTKTAKFDLTLFVEKTAQGLMGTFEYNTDLFESTTISRMAAHFQTLLAGIVNHPETNISRLPILTQSEQHQLLGEWNNTHVNYPQNRCIHQLFEHQINCTPDAVAVIYQNQKLTYRELNQKANQLAHYLQKLGVQSEDLVAICVERNLEMVVALLGILKAGAAYVPLDPAYPQERLAFILEDTQAGVLLTQQQIFVETLDATKVICLDTDWHLIATENQDNCTSNVNSNNLAYIIYTSGSTGKPKGVAIEHRNTVTLLHWAQSVFTSAELTGVLASTSICFDLSVFELFVPLSWGGTVILAENALHLPSLPSAEQVTLINTVPSAIAQLLRTNSIPASVCTINLAGEALPPQLVQQLYELPKIERVFNLYGPSEDTTYSTYSLVARGAKSVTIGRPIANTQVYILDSQQQLVPVGVPGELHIGGDGLARGYLNRPELTAEKFINHSVSNQLQSRLYKTGDLARYLPDGNIEYIGRLDYQVKIRGFRIELGEIEFLLRQHPEVEQAVVVAREDQPGDKRLVAYIIPNVETLHEPSLQQALKDKLPEYMMPSAFVMLEALPLTPNGKIDRKALPAPDFTNSELKASFVEPRTAEEKLLAEIWSQVLGVAKVGIYNNFFELGGHSLLATQIIAKVREVFQVELPLRCLFESPNVASLVKAIATAKIQQPENQPSLLQLPTITPHPENRYQPFPLNEMQQAYWIGRNSFFEMGNVAIHGYAEIESQHLDLERFQLAWQRLVERHDMLRAIIHPDGQQQILQQVPAYQIPVLDLRGQTAEVVDSQLTEIRESLSHQVISLDKWPLFEIRATKFDQQRIRLHISIDALCIDGWSYQILFQDLVQLYRNPNLALPSLQLSFRDYVLAVLELQNSTAFERSLEYWQNRLPTLPPAPELPLAKQPSSVKQPRFQRWHRELASELWKKLKTRAAQTGLSPSGILLAAYAEVLSLWSKSPRFTLNVPRFNRLPLHPQVNDLIGEFASFTLLEVDNSRREAFEVRARRLQEQLWQDLEYQYVSGVRVLREFAQMQGITGVAPMPIIFTTNPQNIGGQTDSSIDALLQELGDVVCVIGQTPQVWIDNQYSEVAGTLLLNWDAVAELFPEGLIADMFAAYYRLLENLATSEAAWQEDTRNLLPPAQLEQRIAVNSIETPISEKLLHTLFAEQVPQRPLQPAVITPSRTLTYAELCRRANQVGHRLRQMGVQVNQLVAVVMDKGWEQIVGVLGIMTAGAAYLPIDPNSPQERLWYLLENGEVEVVLTQSWLNQNLEWPESVQRICLDTEELLEESDRHLPPVQQPDDLAYVLYTSGSTGTPKGVMVAHRGVVNAIAYTNQFFNITDQDKVLALTALHHDMSVYDIFGLLAVGGTIVMPAATTRLDPAHWSELMVQHQVTLWNSVPPMMEMLLEYAAGRLQMLPRCLRWAFLGGDWIPVALPDKLKALVSGAQVVSVGGPTETTLWNIWYPVAEVDPTWKSIPYGQPIANTRYYILNAALEDCPLWVPGEMYCAGVGLAKGYWRNADKTLASFITHPVTGERLYRTGDLGRYLPDGNIEFVGRADFRLKIRGYRIEPGEIEAMLTQHPAVKSAVVMAVGEQHSNQRLVAYIIHEPDAAATPEELCHFLSQKLPEYMVPSAFVILDALPLSANGKVNRRALPVPEMAISQRLQTYVAPRTPVEEMLAEIWSQILNLEQVGVYDNFFDLGGHSLLATQLITKMREIFQVDLSLRDLFELPTIAGLTEKISQVQKQDTQEQKQAIARVSRDKYRIKLSPKH